MNTKQKLSLLACLLCTLFLSQSLQAEEESYERFTVRTWNFRDGSEAKGKLIVVKGPQATLRLDGQGTVRVSFDKLSVKDLNWLYEYHKRRNQLSFLPEEYRKIHTESSLPETKSAPPAKTEPEPAPVENKPSMEPDKKTATEPEAGGESYKPFTLREWSFKDGSSFKAKFVSINPQQIQLIKESGELTMVPLDQLTINDMKWLFEYHRRNKLLGLLPPAMQEQAKALAAQLGLPAEMESPAAAMTEPGTPTAADDDPNVIKANTEIDPELVAVLSDYRFWSDTKGQKSEARFAGLEGREIRFTPSPGSNAGIGIISIPVGTLSDEDLELLREALKMHGRMSELPLAYREPFDSSLSARKLKQMLRVNFHRKWTDVSGNSVAASYIKMENGNISLLITQSNAVQEFPYDKFSEEDHQYVQERLQKEVAGQFFPENAETTLTPEEQQKEFRVWTDRKNRQLKGKFVRLAYGDSVAVLNTGTKEELFITEFFSDGDLSLIKPRKQTQPDQLAMNEGGIPGIPGAAMPGAAMPGSAMQEPGGMNFPGMQNPGMRNPAMPEPGSMMPAEPAMANPAMEPNPAMEMSENMMAENSARNPGRPPRMVIEHTFECELCGKTHTSESPLFEQCPHCGVKRGDMIYQCSRCNKKFKSEGSGLTAPCPYCNPNQGRNEVAANNNFSSDANAGGGESSSSGRRSSNYTSGYRTGRALGKLFFWGLAFLGFIGGALKMRN